MNINKNIFICALLAVMVLFCISAVSADDTFTETLAVSNAADDITDLNVATDDVASNDAKEGETLAVAGEGSSSGSEILKEYDSEKITNDTFFNFFDENGVINKDIPFDKLEFEGEFSGLNISTVTIDTPKTFNALGDAVFKNIGFKILADDVELSGVKIVMDNVDGAAMDIKADGVTVEDVTIDYASAGKSDAFAIRAIESNNLKLLNNIITFNAGYNANFSCYRHAIQIRDSNNVNLKSNKIDAKLPALNVAWTGVSGIDHDLPLAIGIQNGENINLLKNNVTVDVKQASGSYATLDSLMADGFKNLVIEGNIFTQTDFTGANKAGYSNVVDLYNFNGATISANTIKVNTTTGIEGAGSAYAIQATGPYTGLVIDGNDLTAQGKGPSLGIYSQNYNGETDITVVDNVIDVIGFAGDNPWALVSGMELQDTVAKISGNTITSSAINAFNETNNLFGISYAQSTSGNHTYNITNNVVNTDGKYAVYMGNVVDTAITENTLFAHDLEGDEAVSISGDSNVVENNYPPYDADIIIDAPSVWTGSNGNISITVTNATGNVTIKIGNKTYEELVLVNGSVSQAIDASDLTLGANEFTVNYNGDKKIKASVAAGILPVIDGVVTADNFDFYFDDSNNLIDVVPEGATLDFQGVFDGSYVMNINKPVNMISSTGDAKFNSDGEGNKAQLNIVEGANTTNLTGITFINTCVFVKGASNVTIDAINVIANVSRVGSGTGFVSIHSNAYYATVKNCYMENGGTGSSCLVLGKGGKYATFDHNVFNITGSSGNVLSSNIFVGAGENPEFVNYTNNLIYSNVAASSSMYGITVCGQGNVIENNTLINFKGNGIINQYGATSTKNVYRNNTITGGGSMAIGTYSIVEDNYVEGALTVTEGCTFKNNTAKSLTISGKNVVANDNTVKGAVTINAAATNTTFDNNHIEETLTVNSNNNVITNNQISSTGDYAVDLKSTSNNTVKFNSLSSKDKMGDGAVKFVEDKDNAVAQNGMNAIINIDVADSWSGENNTVAINVVNATGSVTIKVNNKEYEAISLVDGNATFVIPAADIEVGLNDLTVTYGGNKVISGDSKTVTFYGLDNVVFQEVFFDFFDESGFLKSDVPYDDLIFKGAFAKSSTVQYIIIDRPVSIVGEDASLSLMGIVISSDNVTVDGLSLTTTVNSGTSALGDLITVNANNVTLSNLKINYRVTRGDYDAIAINVFDADNVKILNNSIIFASVISTDEYSANAINLERVTNALVDNNTITSTLPGLLAENYDFDYFMMGLNTVNPVRMKEVEDSVFSRNSIDSSINNLGRITPTIQSLYIVGSENVLFDSNSFNMVDTKTKLGDSTYLYAFVFGYDKNITVLNNDFYVSTTGGKDSAGTAYALQGVESEIYLIGNNITTISNGPNLGFYVASMMGGTSESYLLNNIFNVTGYATSSQQYALISGAEITNGNAYIYNNTFYTYNKAGFIEIAPVHGVSYGQYMYGERSLDIQNNTMYVQGNYTVGILSGTKANVTNNELYAENLFGDDSVKPGIDGIIENNTPPFDVEMIINGQTVWTGNNSSVNITVLGGTGNVTVRVGNKTFVEVPLVNGTVTLPVNASDLVVGANDIQVTYNGDKYVKPGNDTGNLQVIDGVITSETFKYYFDENNGNYLFDYVPEGATLDFQGSFISDKYSLFINKPVNVISSTEDAVFDSNTTNRQWIKFNVVEGANNTNITGISIINGDLFIQGASYVTVDDIDMKASMSGVGSGTGFLSIHSNAYYTTIKNSHFENGGTGSSCVVLGKGGKYATFDNNVFEITGSSGNVLSSNIFVGKGENPEFVNYTNNVINSHVAGSAFMYGITVCGEGNLIENNSLLNFKGNGIVNQFGATSTKNIYRNNTITGGGSMAIGTYSLVENNNVAEGALTVTEGCTFVNNSAKSITISGKNVVATDNDVATTVTINAAATNTTFANNTVGGLVTVNSNENTIAENTVIAGTEYAVDLKSTKNNTVIDNVLYGSELVGDKAVSFVEDNGNVVENNFPVDPELVVEAEDIKIGENATVNVSFAANITGTVEVIVDGKKYNVDVVDGKGQLNISDLVASKYTVGAYYGGDLLYVATENSTSFTVEKETSQANVTIGEITPEGANVTVSIPGATGNVSIIVDGNETVVPLDENGTATYTIPEVTGGEHSVVVVYDGDDTHSPAHAAQTLYNEEFPTRFTNITVADGKITGILTLPSGDGVADAMITVTVNGVDSNVKTDTNGSFTVEDVFGKVVELKYAGNGTILPTDISIDLTGTAPIRDSTAFVSSDFEQYACDFYEGERGGNFTFQLTDSQGKALANKTVFIGYNGVTYNRTTDENGNAVVQINLKNAGLYTFVIVFLGDENYNASMAVHKININKKPISITASAKTFKATAKTKKYTVTLKTTKGSSVDGKTYLAKGKKVTLTINGKTYTAKTNAKGQATFSLKITKKGKFATSIKFDGDNTYNKASKSVKITIK
ncbi:Ig-like domain repeat protein [Methanobrevibacter sp.]